jgi:protein-tyrosine kinase
MSRLYEALRRSELENRPSGAPVPEMQAPSDLLHKAARDPLGYEDVRSLQVQAAPTNHLVTLKEENSLGAEKFRVLSTRLNNLRAQQEVKTIQVTSAIIDEGKTLVSANLAAVLAKRSNQKVLLVEGDLRQPNLDRLLGLGSLPGISEWWAQPNAPVTEFLYRLEGLPLWLFPAGLPSEHPTEILQSARLAALMTQFSGWFDWIIVDSAPLLPLADANLWARLVDGVLLVVRENRTPRRALEKGLESLDDPKIIGVVLNEASEFDRIHYYDQYYAAQPRGTNGRGQAKTTEPGP